MQSTWQKAERKAAQKMAVAVARKKTRLEEGKGQDVQRDIEDEDRSLKEDAMLAEDDQDPAPDSEKKEKKRRCPQKGC